MEKILVFFSDGVRLNPTTTLQNENISKECWLNMNRSDLKFNMATKMIRVFINKRFSLSIIRKVSTQENKQSEKLPYYYDIPGNKLNPHTYFYRVLGIPFLKVGAMMLGTYFGMGYLWEYMEKEDNKNNENSTD